MKRPKGFLQKVASVSGVISFILSAVCGVWLYLHAAKVEGPDPISASLAASIFFFICVGIVLTVIGRSDLPSFKIK